MSYLSNIAAPEYPLSVDQFPFYHEPFRTISSHIFLVYPRVMQMAKKNSNGEEAGVRGTEHRSASTRLPSDAVQPDPHEVTPKATISRFVPT